MSRSWYTPNALHVHLRTSSSFLPPFPPQAEQTWVEATHDLFRGPGRPSRLAMDRMDIPISR